MSEGKRSSILKKCRMRKPLEDLTQLLQNKNSNAETKEEEPISSTNLVQNKRVTFTSITVKWKYSSTNVLSITSLREYFKYYYPQKVLYATLQWKQQHRVFHPLAKSTVISYTPAEENTFSASSSDSYQSNIENNSFDSCSIMNVQQDNLFSNGCGDGILSTNKSCEFNVCLDISLTEVESTNINLNITPVATSMEMMSINNEMEIVNDDVCTMDNVSIRSEDMEIVNNDVCANNIITSMDVESSSNDDMEIVNNDVCSDIKPLESASAAYNSGCEETIKTEYKCKSNISKDSGCGIAPVSYPPHRHLRVRNKYTNLGKQAPAKSLFHLESVLEIQKKLCDELSRGDLHWKIKELRYGLWSFECLYGTVELNVAFGTCKKCCGKVKSVVLHIAPTEGNVLKMALKCFERKYSTEKLHSLCPGLRNVIFLLQSMTSEIVFIKQFLYHMASLKFTDLVKFSDNKASFFASSIVNRILAEICVPLDIIYMITAGELTDVNVISACNLEVEQMIGEVNVDVIKSIFCTVSINYNFHIDGKSFMKMFISSVQQYLESGIIPAINP